MKDQNIKIQEWVTSSVKSSDYFYDKTKQGNKFLALGMINGKMVATTIMENNIEVRKEDRISFSINNPNLYKLPEDFKGVNPFIEETIQFTNFNLDGIFSYIGFDRNDEKDFSCRYGYPECNFNPYFIIEGEKHHYQRGYVWTLEQKQNLINSIYRGLESGRIIVHSHDFNVVKNLHEKGFTDFAFRDIIDGKQRISTIIEFVQDKFEDEFGNKFSDLSKSAQRFFYDYKGLLYGELKGEATPDQIANIFLNNATAGTPISKEHIDYMIKIKEMLIK